MRTTSESESYDETKSQHQKKDFWRFQLTVQKYGGNLASNVIPTEADGWYVVENGGADNMQLGRSWNPNMPFITISPGEKHIIWLQNKELLFVHGTPLQYFNVAFFGAHKPQFAGSSSLTANIGGDEANPINVLDEGLLCAEHILSIVDITPGDPPISTPLTQAQINAMFDKDMSTHYDLLTGHTLIITLKIPFRVKWLEAFEPDFSPLDSTYITVSVLTPFDQKPVYFGDFDAPIKLDCEIYQIQIMNSQPG